MTTKRLEGVVRDATSGAGVGSVTVTVKKVSDASTVTSTTTDNSSDVGYYSRLHDVVGYPGPIFEEYTSGATTKRRDGRVHGQLGGLVWADDVGDVFAANGIGVVPGVGGELAVTADGASGLQVAVAAGMALLKDGLPFVLETGVNAAITSNSSGNPRIDRVVLRETREGQTDQGKIAIVVIAGTPAASPVPPALTQTAATWDYSLAQVLVGNGVANITSDKTSEERSSVTLGQAYAWVNKLTTAGDLQTLDAFGKPTRLAIGTSSQYLKGGTVPAYGSIAAGDLPAAIDAAKIADGSVTSAEFQFINSLSSNAQTQLDGKQPLDATLTAVAAYNTNGLVTQTAADTFAGRTLTAPAAGFTVTNPAGVAGNPTFVLANDLAAVEGLATTGLATRTAADTWAVRTLAGTANQITLANGDGVAGNPTVSLPAAITAPGSLVVTTDATVNGNTTLGNGDTDATVVQGHLKHKSAAPGIAPGVALGTGGSVGATLVGTDQAGTLSLVAGTTSPTIGIAATITFATARPDTNYVTILTPENANAGANAVLVRAPGPGVATTTTWTVQFGAAPTSGFTYKFHYLVVEWTN